MQLLFKSIENVENDGRCLDQAKDPPGQSSVYIPPGDTERESYRLSTFKEFPPDVPINPCQFAVNGFYYTGYKDRVKCFSCGQSCENWLAGDDISLAVWHKRDCEFKNGTDITNIPISGSNFSRFLTESSRSSSLPGTSQQTAGEIITSIFGTRRPSAPHPGEIAETTNTEASASATQGNCSDLPFPCLNPINPHMRRTEARLQTFTDNARLWPSYRLRATPEEIADAGMYFLGERDRVKCWYCNGGLQNWVRNDDPWVEHAKWFPMCEYLLQRKGPDFVHRIVAQYPDLRRPTLLNPANSTATTSRITTIMEANTSLRRPLMSSEPARGTRPMIVDPRQELREQNRKIDQIMTSSELVSEARLMGFDDDVIKAAFKRKYESTKEGFSSFSALVDAILSVSPEETSNTLEEEESSSSTSGIDRSMSVSNMTPSEGMEEMRRLEESRTCRICKSNPACMVFIPCGHLACCADCGKDIERCPICNSYIRERVRSYIA